MELDQITLRKLGVILEELVTLTSFPIIPILKTFYSVSQRLLCVLYILMCLLGGTVLQVFKKIEINLCFRERTKMIDFSFLPIWLRQKAARHDHCATSSARSARGSVELAVLLGNCCHSDHKNTCMHAQAQLKVTRKD